jgi:hypothetical protein
MIVNVFFTLTRAGGPGFDLSVKPHKPCQLKKSSIYYELSYFFYKHVNVYFLCKHRARGLTDNHIR